jgi:hypothetical protein
VSRNGDRREEMMDNSQIRMNYYGGRLGLVLLIVIIVLLFRRRI